MLPVTPYLSDQSKRKTSNGVPGSLRERISQAKRIVVKVGSSSLTGPGFVVDPARIDALVDAVQTRMSAGSDVVVVSSGTIAAGMAPLGLTQRPVDLATKQAAASVGQVHLAHEWGRSFGRYGRVTGQVLLTAGDAGRRDRARNAQRTIERLRQLRAVPIVNENDTVATTEMRFGDNDRLAAIVAHLITADALILLSDVDGLYDKNPAEPDARFIAEVRDGNDLKNVVAGDGGIVGTGGMASKVSAARLASRCGIPVLLTSAASITDALGAAEVGTVFYPKKNRLSAWKFWALYAADVAGTLRIDAGAVTAVTSGGKSLLAVGIESLEGEFQSGEIVEIMGPGGEIIGRGEVNYDSQLLSWMIGKHTSELPAGMHKPVVHADYLSDYASRA
ncbi:Glutamate 5-kinase [Corynebacterium canis]|nr:Glutamate 5-kinase [Corynebacterium canis]